MAVSSNQKVGELGLFLLRPLSAQLPSTNHFCERNEGIKHA